MIPGAPAGVGHGPSYLAAPGRAELLPGARLRSVLSAMLARGTGHLVGISSVAAFKGLPTSAAW